MTDPDLIHFFWTLRIRFTRRSLSSGHDGRSAKCPLFPLKADIVPVAFRAPGTNAVQTRGRETVAQSNILRLLAIWLLLSGFSYRPCLRVWAMPFAAMTSRLWIVIVEDLL